MAARNIAPFTVFTADELDELEEAIGAGQLDAVALTVPDDSNVLQTAREFRRLLSASRSAGVDLELTTDDPLRRELAQIMGVRLSSESVLDIPSPDTPRAEGPLPSSATFRIVQPPSPKPTGGTLSSLNDDETAPTFQPWRSSVSEPTDLNDDDPSFSFVIHPPTVRRPVTQTTERPPKRTETLPSFDVWEAPYGRNLPLRNPRRRAKVVTLVGAFVTLVVASAFVALWLLPAATIAVAPVEAPISTSLTYGVALPGTTYDITVEPETVSTTLTFSATIPTTGERFEPDAPARGAVLLTNASTGEVFVPAGTILLAAGGQQFATAADVTVPAADPYGTLTIGSATIEVVAVAPGPDSNVAAETVYGQLDNGIYYLNRDPIGGGTTKRIATVSQADVDALTQRAKNDLEPKAERAVASRLTADQHLLDGTEQRSAIDYRFDKPVGSDGATLKLDASLTVSAQAYRLDDIHARAREAVVDRLRAQAGQDVTVITSSLRVSNPRPLDGANGTAFAVDATATTRTTIDATELDALRAELSGLDETEALARIEQVAGVGAVRIETSPGWLSDGMPRRSSRIQIEVVDAATLPAQATSARP